MAKTTLPVVSPKAVEVEIQFTAMRKVGVERYEVVTGYVRATPVITKVLERSVSLAVGRDTAKRSMRRQAEQIITAIGLPAKN